MGSFLISYHIYLCLWIINFLALFCNCGPSIFGISWNCGPLILCHFSVTIELWFFGILVLPWSFDFLAFFCDCWALIFLHFCVTANRWFFCNREHLIFCIFCDCEALIFWHFSGAADLWFHSIFVFLHIFNFLAFLGNRKPMIF